MPTIGFLHTADVHVTTFRSLVAERSSEVEVVEIVDADLLARAAEAGPESVADGLAAALADLRSAGADRIVCTCSTLGALAERLGGGGVIRVDRPMARAAVADGAPLAVGVALEATIEPTLGLLAEEAEAAGTTPEIEVVAVPEAWARFLAGDQAGYLDALAAAIGDRIDPERTVVLAQGSMAPLVERLGDRTVLASPALAVRFVLDQLDTTG